MSCLICGNNKLGFFARKNNCTIVKCLNCGLLFVDPPVVETKQVYDESYFTGSEKGFGYIDYEADKQPMVPAFNIYMSLVEELNPTKGKLLDVGAATGFFIAIAEKRGWEGHGVEISEYAARYARAKGFKVETGTLSGREFPKESFDCVTMFDVIEHFPNPRTEITRAREVLKKGGILVINTPDTGSLLGKLLKSKWHLIIPPEHLFYFNRSNLSQLLEQEGFEVVSFKKIGKRFTLEYICIMLYKWQKLSLWKKMSDFFKKPWFQNISIPLNTRDNMLIIARKK